MPEDAGTRVVLGVVGRPHGVRGLVHVNSFTEDPARLTAYGDLLDGMGRVWRLRWRGEGIAELAEVVDGRARVVADRIEAARLTNTRLTVPRERLPDPDADEFYVADLVGLEAAGVDGAALGPVVAVHDYGGGPSLEIAAPSGPLLVPFTRACVPEVDLGARRLTVLPPAEVG